VSLVIQRASLHDPAARAPIGALNTELLARYPEEGATHFRLDADEIAPGRGTFLVAAHDAIAIGCGAFRRLDAEIGEIKRMYVVVAARGGGVGGRILARLEEVDRLGPPMPDDTGTGR
jgi:GNAT superfamily N-acetyltransferase